MGNVGIKFKEFVLIYNFTCFKLMQMYLKSHGKCRNKKKKNFSIFYIRLTSMHNCKSQIQWIGQILFIPTSIYIYIYICETSCEKVWGFAKWHIV